VAFIFRYPRYGRFAVQSFLDVLRWIVPLLELHGGRLVTIAVSAGCLRFLMLRGLAGKPPTLAPAGEVSAVESPPKAVVASRVTWLCALATPVIAVVMWLIALGNEPGPLPDIRPFLFWLALIFAPYALIAWRLWRGPDRFGLGFASGFGLLTLGAGITYGGLLLFVLILGYGWGSPREKSSSLFIGFAFLVIVILNLFLFVAAMRASILMRGTGKPSSNAWGAGFAVPLLVSLVLPGMVQVRGGGSTRSGGVVTTRVSTYPGRTTEDLKREKAAKALARAYARCAFVYFGAHPQEGFPRETRKLGPGGISCLDANQLNAHLEGYNLSYQAFSSPGATRIDALRAVVLPEPALVGAAVKQGFLVEETGQMRNVTMSAANPPASPQLKAAFFNYSPTIGFLSTLSRCLNRARFYSGSDEYPQTLDETLNVADPSTHVKCVADFEVNGPEPITASALRSNRFASRGYTFTYAAVRDAAGRATQYTLEARPAHYAEEEFRSYLVDASGIIRYTPLDRSATPGDPEIPLCDLNREMCEIAPTPET
jgi:hypothetical protein